MRAIVPDIGMRRQAERGSIAGRLIHLKHGPLGAVLVLCPTEKWGVGQGIFLLAGIECKPRRITVFSMAEGEQQTPSALLFVQKNIPMSLHGDI